MAVDALGGSARARTRPALRSFLPIAGRIARIGVATLALVAGLSEMGFPIASILARLEGVLRGHPSSGPTRWSCGSSNSAYPLSTSR